MLSGQPKWVRRIVIILLTMLAALICRTLAVAVLDIDFISYKGEIGHEAIDVGIRPVLVVPAITGLLGWGILAILERTMGATRTARTAWTVGALVVLIASILPLIPWSMPGETKIVLIAMHIVVAATYIPLMWKTVAATPTT